MLLLPAPSSWANGWSGPGSGSNIDALRLDEIAASASARYRALEDHPFLLGNFLSALPARCSVWSAALLRPITTPSPIADLVRSAARGIGNPWGLVVATFHRRGVPEKFADHPGIPNPALCPDRYHDAFCSVRRDCWPRPVRRIFPGCGMTYLLESPRTDPEIWRRGGVDNLDLAVVPNEIIA